MILIQITDKDLLRTIASHRPGWFEKARKKTAAARKAGKVGDKDGIWSEIKEVFIRLQEFKCIYCEFPLPKVDAQSINKVAVDHDVEHFRPKNRVTPWPTPETLARRPQVRNYQSHIKSGAPAGYLRLAFDPLNYVVSCKVCNSSYKANCFPISGKADSRSRKRKSLDLNEEPLLLFPLGEDGDDPTSYLAFDGPTLGLSAATGHARLRGQTVIDFFELDTREGLLAGRCLLIRLLWPYLEDEATPDPVKSNRAKAFLDTVRSGHSQLHTACGRSFIQLYGRDRDRALAWFDAAGEYLTSKDPSILQALESGP